jgi:O-antigen ligase
MRVRSATNKLRTLRLPYGLSGPSLLFPLGVLFAIWAGVALGTGSRRTMLLGLGGIALASPAIHYFWARKIKYGALGVEVPLILLLLSTIVFRQRSADQLAYNPLDPAAQFRVLCVLVALGLGAIAVTVPRAAHSGRLTVPIRLYIVYIVIVFIGAPLSVNPSLTAYRGVELVAGVTVLAGAWRIAGAEAVRRIEAVLYWFMVALVMSVWLGLVLYHHEAVHSFANTYVPIKFQVTGVNPIMSSNTVGALGVTLAVWSILRVRWPLAPNHQNRTLANGLALLGVATLLVAQYRTGYASLLVTGIVFLVLRKKWPLAFLLAIAAAAFIVLVPSLLTKAEPFVLRGQTVQQARGLSERVDWWGSGIKVWEESPLIGRGLLTATRFEVLAALGRDKTSTIHSTWVEALVGTGLIGLSLLILVFALTMKRAVNEALRGGRPFALLLLTSLSVRTITGNSIESFSFEAVVFLMLALALRDTSAPRLS